MTMTGPGLPVTKEQKTNWQRVFNNSGEKIPPFACMMRQPDTVSSLVVDAEGCDVWAVDKPSLWVEGGQNGGHLIFNGPDPIEPERYGRGTLDYPTKAIILASEVPQPGTALGDVSGSTFYLDGTDIYIGPRSGSWLLWAEANPYWDDTYLAKPTPNAMIFRGYSQVPHGLGDKIKTCIVEPAPKQSPIIYATQEEGFFSAPAGPFTATGQNICTGYWDDQEVGFEDNDDLPMPKLVGTTGGDTTNSIGIGISGLYQCIVSGLMWSDTTEQSAFLAGMMAAKRLKKGSTTDYDYWETGLEFARYQTIDYDQYGVEKWRSKENVCASQLMNLLKGDTLYLMNAATTNWTLAYATLSLYRIGNPGSFSTRFYPNGVM